MALSPTYYEDRANSASFDAWMRKVDRTMEQKIGLDSDDLADAPWMDFFVNGLTPTEAIKDALVEYNDVSFEEMALLGFSEYRNY
jgi:hypothetical protein